MRRRVTTDDPYDGRGFRAPRRRPQLRRHHPRRSAALAVREVGPEDAPLTVVFAHGFCLRMGAFYFQRARLAEQWGPQVRMVFYDQRGHGQSGEAPPDTYTVDAAGPGPGNRARRDGAARPGGAGRAFDGRHDGAVARSAVPAALSRPASSVRR